MFILRALIVLTTSTSLGLTSPVAFRFSFGDPARDQVSQGPGDDGAPLLIDTSGSLLGRSPIIAERPGDYRSVITLSQGQPPRRTPGLYDYFSRFFSSVLSSHHNHHEEEDDEYDYTRSKSVIKIKTNENEYHQHHPAIIRPATNTDPISVIRAPVDSVPVIRPPTNTGNESRGKSVVKINNLRPGLKFSILQKPRLVEEEQDSGLSVIRPATNTPSFQQTSVIREAENVPIIRPRIVDAFE